MIQSITISDCVGTYSQCVLKGDILQCIDHAKRLGYEGVEMHMRNAKLNDYNRIKDYADRLQMKVTGIGTGMACYADGHYLTNPDKLARKEAQQVLIDFLEAAHTLGDTVVLFGLMKGSLPDKDPRTREKCIDTLYDIGYDRPGRGVLGHEYNADPDPVTAAVGGYKHIKQFLI